MKYLILALVSVLLVGPAQARTAQLDTRHDHYVATPAAKQIRQHVRPAAPRAKRHYTAARMKSRSARVPSHTTRHEAAHSLVTVKTAAGVSITVAANLASQFVGFINDLVVAGYKPGSHAGIGCYDDPRRGGHIPNSNHYRGAACDIDQTGRNETAAYMRHIGDLAKKWGLRDGCLFHDCGHVEVPR